MRDLTWKHLLGMVAADVEGADGPAASDDAWSEIRRRLTILAIRRVPAEDREDVVQEILIRMRAPAIFETILNSRIPSAYVARIVRNAALDLARRKTRLVPLISEPGTAAPRRPPDVEAILARVNDEDRKLIHMRFWLGLSLSEIAAELQLPYSTVAKRMFRLVSRLRQWQEGSN